MKKEINYYLSPEFNDIIEKYFDKNNIDKNYFNTYTYIKNIIVNLEYANIYCEFLKNLLIINEEKDIALRDKLLNGASKLRELQYLEDENSKNMRMDIINDICSYSQKEKVHNVELEYNNIFNMYVTIFSLFLRVSYDMTLQFINFVLLFPGLKETDVSVKTIKAKLKSNGFVKLNDMLETKPDEIDFINKINNYSKHIGPIKTFGDSILDWKKEFYPEELEEEDSFMTELKKANGIEEENIYSISIRDFIKYKQNMELYLLKILDCLYDIVK